MSHECDGSLGAPSVADCDQLEWQGLGGAGRNVVLHPGTTNAFSSSKYIISGKYLDHSTIVKLWASPGDCVETPHLHRSPTRPSSHQLTVPRAFDTCTLVISSPVSVDPNLGPAHRSL